MNLVRVCDETGNAGRLGIELRKTLLRALRILRLRNFEISLLLTTDCEIARLNRIYRGIRRPTDVLSFSQGDRAGRSSRTLLGDIAISLPTARRQARRAGHPVRRECVMLAVHGLLHLLGHDHADPEKADTMFGLQDGILSEVARVR